MYICLVCGYDKLSQIPYDVNNNPSYEICDCCGFEYGYDDLSNGDTYESYRKKWIESGARWFNQSKQPINWSLEQQLNVLKNIE